MRTATLLVFAFLSLHAAPAAAQAAAPSKPNILVVWGDDIGEGAAIASPGVEMAG
jgi:hypothetical protein